MSPGQRVGLVLVFAWFLLGGLGHLLYDDFYVRMVPPYVQSPETVLLVTGVLEVLGAFGVLLAGTRRVAGLCLFVLALVVTVANVHMWVHFDQFPESPSWLLGARLLLQVFVLALILFSTQPLTRHQPA